MQTPKLSAHFQSRKPSAIRTAQIEFMKRTDGTEAINTAIGNVTLPAHPAMLERLTSLGEKGPFVDGVIKYSPTVGTKECCETVLHIIASSDLSTHGLMAMITDGGSSAMELLIVGVCGTAGSHDDPLMLIDAAYTNYNALAQRTGRKTISIQRELDNNGRFTLPAPDKIEAVIQKHKPAGLLVIPYDNPTGQYYDHALMVSLGRLCVKYNMWFVSDEAYRELFYCKGPASSIWRITEKEVPGITGRRISIETASKVWNACGLRIGALVTDNSDFHAKAVAEYTANLCSNVIGQYVFGALKDLPHQTLKQWYIQQRRYYQDLMGSVSAGLKAAVPGLIVSVPDASIYSVIDVKNVARPGFDAEDFVLYCARKGRVMINNKYVTLLVSPMAEFYKGEIEPNPGRTQMRIAYVESPTKMAHVPHVFKTLFEEYEKTR
ncbi:MAG: aminotransferase class I/II-fold pyridoxal phosphate-dependent enzyme [Deltaproteobacteria bacterium]|nr:aminotransferase class I/II-fold pyridoxal phosphate-dependent enzyme [Deltaproteobacteria bacterium]